MITTLLAIASIYTPAVTLEIQDTRFIVDGKPTFLLGASYYGALGAPNAFVERDLHELKENGFNWIRVWATWDAFGSNVSAVDAQGNAREPYLSRLKSLCEKADQLGMIVDVTLTRGRSLPSQEAHLSAVAVLAQELRQFRNIYLDVGNERNIRDARYVSFEEASALRNRIKELDPNRLVTASYGSDIPLEEIDDCLEVVQVDFITPHRPRDASSPRQTMEKTRQYLDQMRKLGKVVPVHYQEPFRRGYGSWQPKAEDFLTDLRNSIAGGAAGWCLHNGDTRGKDDGRPRRSFDMHESEGRMFQQLDDDEKSVVEKASSIVNADL
jgi:hypothetical protein